jgi:two-component system sensor histidine kinase PilS (NtrC family)
VAYATTLVYLSGGVFSPFASLYPLAIIGGAILLFRKGAVAIATASTLAYGLLVDLQFYGLIEPLNPFPLPLVAGGKVVPQLLFNVVAFYAVGLLSGYLAEELRRAGERLEVVEAEVRDLEHLQDSILHNLGSGLVAVDRQGCQAFHNSAAEALLARAGIELNPGTDLTDVFDLEDGERREVAFFDGRLTLGYTVSPLYDRGGQNIGSILIFRDLIDVKRLEEELRRSDRLAAVGRLAAGLAHEVRNPLASLSGSVEVLMQSVGSGDDSAALFEIVLRETERLNRLVTNFLHYARPSEAQRSAISLRDLVTETGFFFSQGKGRKGFTMENRVPSELRLSADRAQMEQLLLNLLRNSSEAAPDRVKVTVEAAKEGGTVIFSVRDDGPGMPVEVAEQAFEPFFTRNKAGGTGLGLATVHRIAENHGGSVTLEMAKGRGATFRFHLPADAESAAAAAPQYC